MNYKIINHDIHVTDVPCLNIELCLFCGQAFRWKTNPDGSFHGVVKGKVTDIYQSENEIIFKNTSENDFLSVWQDYFDMNKDYKSLVAAFDSDQYLKNAAEEYYGIRILHQEPWETICSFIISQNNNIPRIMGIVQRLCESFGDKIGENDYTFPSYEKIAALTCENLAPLRAGFRSKYIIDAARKIASGEVDLHAIESMPMAEARLELKKIKGVGDKVAECSLLYGFKRYEAFPVDVWVKRLMSEWYSAGLPKCTENIEGIAQQYLFHYRRNSPEFKGET